MHVESYTDPPEGLLEYRQWVLRLGQRRARDAPRVAEGRPQGAALVARLEGVADRDAAAAFTGAVIEVERAALPPTRVSASTTAPTWSGCRVQQPRGRGAGYGEPFRRRAARCGDGDADAGGREHWVLAVPAHLRRVDLAARAIVVDWPAELE